MGCNPCGGTKDRKADSSDKQNMLSHTSSKASIHQASAKKEAKKEVKSENTT